MYGLTNRKLNLSQLNHESKIMTIDIRTKFVAETAFDAIELAQKHAGVDLHFSTENIPSAVFGDNLQPVAVSYQVEVEYGIWHIPKKK